jgi:hypothetical protein
MEVSSQFHAPTAVPQMTDHPVSLGQDPDFEEERSFAAAGTRTAIPRLRRPGAVRAG